MTIASAKRIRTEQSFTNVSLSADCKHTIEVSDTHDNENSGREETKLAESFLQSIRHLLTTLTIASEISEIYITLTV